MSSSVEFGAYFAYSPRGTSDTSTRSRRVRDAVKRANSGFLQKAAARVGDEAASGILAGFFDDSAILVPAPRSAPLAAGYPWPGDRIANALVEVGIGAEVRPLLTRTESVPKAAYARAGERPTVAKHEATLAVEVELGEPSHFVIVDDVVTKGTMLYACANVIRGAYPNTDVRGFALLRTMGLIPEVEAIIEPCLGTITLNRWGDPHRKP